MGGCTGGRAGGALQLGFGSGPPELICRAVLRAAPAHMHALKVEVARKAMSVDEVLLALRWCGKFPLARLQQAAEHLRSSTGTSLPAAFQRSVHFE